MESVDSPWTPPPDGPGPHPSPVREPGSKTVSVLTGLWLAVLVPGGLFVGLVSVFVFSPTKCPDTGGSLLCRQPGWQGGSIMLVWALLALSGVLAILGLAQSDHGVRRQWGWLLGSVGVVGLCWAWAVVATSGS